MHILLIHQAFAAMDDPGGTRHHELARHLTRLGHKVTVITSPVSYLTGKNLLKNHWKETMVDDLGVTIIRAWTIPALHRSFVWRIFSFLSFMVSSFFIGLSIKHVDLLWGTTPPIFQGVTAWLIARLKRVPFLFEVRDLWPAFAIAVGVLKNRLLIKLSKWLERFLYRHADHVVINSPGFFDHVKQRGAQKITLIPNGSDPEMFDPNNSGLLFREKHQLGNRFIVLYAGAHGMSNDLDTLVETADLLRDDPSVIIVMIGDGKEKPDLMHKAERLDLDNLLFLPPLAKNQMDTALGASNACVAILKPIEMYKTTYPNKVFDYMAAAKPVLLAIDGVIRQVVEKANAGIFVTPGDPVALAEKIRYLKDNPLIAQEMGQAGRITVQTHFSRQKISDQFNQLILSIRRTHD